MASGSNALIGLSLRNGDMRLLAPSATRASRSLPTELSRMTLEQLSMTKIREMCSLLQFVHYMMRPQIKCSY